MRRAASGSGCGTPWGLDLGPPAKLLQGDAQPNMLMEAKGASEAGTSSVMDRHGVRSPPACYEKSIAMCCCSSSLLSQLIQGDQCQELRFGASDDDVAPEYGTFTVHVPVHDGNMGLVLDLVDVARGPMISKVALLPTAQHVVMADV
eukprot:Skav224138  [mRNA]  locus=scaffold462:158992:159992:- [translate_table: standard]